MKSVRPTKSPLAWAALNAIQDLQVEKHNLGKAWWCLSNTRGGKTWSPLSNFLRREDLGFRIKHLGIARRTDAGIELRVHPTLIPEEELIANVNGVKNAVLVQANAVGPTLYYGAGAGAGPTASAVVADVVDIVRDISYTEDGAGTIPQLAFEALTDLPILSREQMTTGYYIRINAEDQTGVLADVTTILSRAGISIDAIMQQSRLKDLIPIVILTDPVQESKMDEALQQIQALPVIHGEIVRIRLESLDN